MTFTPAELPALFAAIQQSLTAQSEEITALDQAIGDGDHVINLQRGLNALLTQTADFTPLDWANAFQKIGVIVMSTVGGASGLLYCTLFVEMAKAAKGQVLTLASFTQIFQHGVTAMKQRGKADVGEKTLLDVYIPVANYLTTTATNEILFADLLDEVSKVATAGMKSTQEMLATKGRASFLGERSRGTIDAGAKTAQLMILEIVAQFKKQFATA